MNRGRFLLLTSTLALSVACSPDGTPQTAPTEPTSAGAERSAPPEPKRFAVEEVATGLEHAWDVGFLPDGQMLVTERPGRLQIVDNGRKSQVRAQLDDVYDEGEAGLMGLAIHPDFERTRGFNTCHAHAEDDEPVDVRVVSWTLAEDGRSAQRDKTLIDRLPLADGGRHSGCRLEVDNDGNLLVGTGDTADPGVPQSRTRLGGKVLRVDLDTGEGTADNPFADDRNADSRRILTYGHRNVQGIAADPKSNAIYSAEHGPDVDDEVNRISSGGNYGWDPSQGGTVDDYDEGVPMTDTRRFPDAVRPLWTTGDETEAICGLELLRGEQWGEWDGSLATTALAGEKLILLQLEDGKITSTEVPEELDGEFGRLRAARLGPDGDLYVTTSDGDDDKLLKISPR